MSGKEMRERIHNNESCPDFIFFYVSIYLVLAALGPRGRVGFSSRGDRGTVLL